MHVQPFVNSLDDQIYSKYLRQNLGELLILDTPEAATRSENIIKNLLINIDKYKNKLSTVYNTLQLAVLSICILIA